MVNPAQSMNHGARGVPTANAMVADSSNHTNPHQNYLISSGYTNNEM